MSTKAQSPAEFAAQLRTVADFVERHPELGTPDAAHLFYFRRYSTTLPALTFVDAFHCDGWKYRKEGRDCVAANPHEDIKILGYVPDDSFVPVVTISETTYYELPKPTEAA